jgi:lysophospholipase L1-like esterase
MTTKVISVFGDSSTWGAFDFEKGGWVERLKTVLMKKGIFVYNLGIESNTTEEMLERFESELKSRIYSENPADFGYSLIVIFEIGQNDSLHKDGKHWVELDKFEKNLEELIKKAKKFSKHLIFLGLPKVDEKETIPWDENGSYDNKTIERYNSVLKKICEDKKVYFISNEDLSEKKDLHDGVHANSEGHRKIFEKVKSFLIKNNIL